MHIKKKRKAKPEYIANAAARFLVTFNGISDMKKKIIETKLNRITKTQTTCIIMKLAETLLDLISFNCKKECDRVCGCRESDLKCIIVCRICSGQPYENVPEDRIESEDDDKEISHTLRNCYIFDYLKKCFYKQRWELSVLAA